MAGRTRRALHFLFGWVPVVGDWFSIEDKGLPPPPKDFPCAKVAIIGAGVGGCSAAYFLRELCGESLELHVFSDGPVGGRTAVIEMDGHIYEAGASVAHSSNKYLVDFRKKFGLKEKRSKDERTTPVGIFNGTQFVLQTGFFSVLNSIRLLWRYGCSMFRLSRYVSSVIKKFSNVYDQQLSGKTFQTVPDMLRAIGGEEMYRLTQITATQRFTNEMHLQQKLVEELICCAMKVNYGQNNNVDAFTALVSLAGMEGGSLWSVVGGNFLIPKAALDHSKAIFHPVKVQSVTRSDTSNEPTYSLEYVEMSAASACSEDCTVAEETDLPFQKTDVADGFDVVVVALPLDVSTIQFQNFPSYIPPARALYHRTVATFIKGTINPQFFGKEKLTRSFPFDVLTTDMKGCSVDFNSVSVQIPSEITVDEEKPFVKPLPDNPVRVWKVFSNRPLSDADKNKLFGSIEAQHIKDWMAYPEYNPPERFPSFVLDNGTFYINGIEKAASAMEMSAIGAMNVSLLARDYILASKKSM